MCKKTSRTITWELRKLILPPPLFMQCWMPIECAILLRKLTLKEEQRKWDVSVSTNLMKIILSNCYKLITYVANNVFTFYFLSENQIAWQYRKIRAYWKTSWGRLQNVRGNWWVHWLSSPFIYEHYFAS